MKTKYFLLYFLILSQTIFAQDITGEWKGELEFQGVKLPLIFHIEKDGNKLKSTMDSPMQGATGIPVDKTEFVENTLSIEVTPANLVYTGKLVNDKIEGTLSQNGMKFSMTFYRMKENESVLNRPQTPEPPFNYQNEEVQITNEIEGNKLAGTLTTPFDFNKNSPIYILITGSGPQNRDSELFGHKTFLVIADYLANKGIATLRLDDRGMGESEMGKENATIEDFVGDINSAVNFLAKIGYKNIGLLGHSEGGLIAPMVANNNKKVKSIILLAAPGIPIDDLMELQTYEVAKSSGLPDNYAQILRQQNGEFYDFVKNYQGNNFEKEAKNFLMKLAKNSFSQYQSEEAIQSAIAFADNNAFQYFIKANPQEYLSKTKVPVLAINGSLDTQVTSKENLEGIKNSLVKAGNKHFEIKEIKNLNHLLQTAKTGSPAEYSQIEETISPEVLEAISEWINKK